MSNIIPKKLCIFYGYPSLVASTIPNAIDVFNDYDIIVFGDGLQNPSHPDYNKSVQIITGIPQTQVFGYIDSRLSFNNIKNKINQWKVTGVAGIFCDQFGYDNGITRKHQNNIVNYIHNKGLIAFVNSWNPDDTFGSTLIIGYNPTGMSPAINANDWYLAQSYQIINGTYANVTDWKIKSDKMKTYKNLFGTKMACISTYDTSSYDQLKADYSYFSCAMYGFDAWGFGEYNYSATSSSLPFRPRKQIYGNKFVDNIINNNFIYERQTNIGIKINTNNHTVDILLD